MIGHLKDKTGVARSQGLVGPIMGVSGALVAVSSITKTDTSITQGGGAI